MKAPRYRTLILFLLPVVLAACAAYHPRPLPGTPGLSAQVPRLSVEAQSLKVPGIRPHPFDPSDGLDMTEVAMLAVANNPRLKAARANAGIGRAQVFAAGLLPDPELSFGLEHPTGGAPGLVNAMSLALNYPLQPLVGRGAARHGAAARLRQIDLEVVWQEWQVAQQARIMYVRLLRQGRQLELLREFQRTLKGRYESVRRSLRSGNMTAGPGTSVLSALAGIDTRLNEVERAGIRTREALAGLLGLDPEVELLLADCTPGGTMDAGEIDNSLTTLAQRRPDLLALRAGYESEDARLRKAVLEQFPGLSFGVSRARDTDGINTVGIGVTLRLPFLNGNRGSIAVEEATREQLRSAYQARLAEAHTGVHQLRSEMRLLEGQLRQARSRLSELGEVASRAALALDEGNLDIPAYVTIETGLMDRRIKFIRLEGSLQEVRIVLETLLGMPVDDLTAGGKE
ncbi:MAG: TolC family protein [Thermodesulfobacteriota bacterium]